MRSDAIGFPISLDVEGQKVLIVGDDEEVARKRMLLERAGALVVERKQFTAADLEGARLVLVAARDPQLAEAVHVAAQARGVLTWCCDDSVHSDLAMPAVVVSGSATVAIATGGRSPTLAAEMRAALEATLDDSFAQFVSALGRLRAETKNRYEDFSKRREVLRQALEGFTLSCQVRYPDWFK